MNNYRDIALKLGRYFERHLVSHPEWEEALELAQDWKAVMEGGDHDPCLIVDRASLLDAGGSAVDELKLMIRLWSAGASPKANR